MTVRANSDTTGLSSQGKREGFSLAPGLYLVATPIGNLGDITVRALEVLRYCDLIACEDTRVSRKLLSHYGISTALISYHDHNAQRVRPQIAQRIEAGGSVALISDAGSPLISDPGHKLVADLVVAGCAITSVPGPAAPIAALQLSGLPSDRFLFAGFLPSRSAARKTVLADLSAVPSTLIFFESVGRLAASLSDVAAVLGDRPAAVARELTKRYEEVQRGSLSELAAKYEALPTQKGEVVLLVGPPDETQRADEAEIDAVLTKLLANLRTRDAADTAAASLGIPRKLAYARALALKSKDGFSE